MNSAALEKSDRLCRRELRRNARQRKRLQRTLKEFILILEEKPRTETLVIEVEDEDPSRV